MIRCLLVRFGLFLCLPGCLLLGAVCFLGLLADCVSARWEVACLLGCGQVIIARWCWCGWNVQRCRPGCWCVGHNLGPGISGVAIMEIEQACEFPKHGLVILQPRKLQAIVDQDHVRLRVDWNKLQRAGGQRESRWRSNSWRNRSWRNSEGRDGWRNRSWCNNPGRDGW